MRTVNHPLYHVWLTIKQRCTSPKHPSYPFYGGQGIRIADSWMKFPVFLRDVEFEIGPQPEGMSLIRKDEDGDYVPGNIKWGQKPFKGRSRELPRSPHKCTYTGVVFDVKGRSHPYKAQVGIEGTTKHIGYFKTERAAAEARDAYVRDLMGTTGRKYKLNFPEKKV